MWYWNTRLSGHVRMIPECTGLVRHCKVVQERVVGWDGALRDERRTISIISRFLEQPVPVLINSRFNNVQLTRTLEQLTTLVLLTMRGSVSWSCTFNLKVSPWKQSWIGYGRMKSIRADHIPGDERARKRRSSGIKTSEDGSKDAHELECWPVMRKRGLRPFKPIWSDVFIDDVEVLGYDASPSRRSNVATSDCCTVCDRGYFSHQNGEERKHSRRWGGKGWGWLGQRKTFYIPRTHANFDHVLKSKVVRHRLACSPPNKHSPKVCMESLNERKQDIISKEHTVTPVFWRPCAKSSEALQAIYLIPSERFILGRNQCLLASRNLKERTSAHKDMGA